MANEANVKEEGSKSLAVAANKIANLYISDVSNLNEAVGIPMTEESKRCAINAVLSLCGEIGASEVAKLPKEQIVQVLQFVSINGLDVFNGQVFLDKRKNKNGGWSVKATPMGSAYEIMTAHFGVNVKTVHPARIVHEEDEFELPQFDGLKMTNVKHKMTLKGLDGKAIAVYYIIEKNDGTLDFAIATRDGVAKNLMAQILNASLRSADANRGEMMKRMEGKDLDQILSDPYFAPWISPAYRSPASRETMIIAKMKKNALMHYTRDLGASQNKAFSKVNSEFVDTDSDMVVDQAPEAPKLMKEKSVIQDFEVEGGEETTQIADTQTETRETEIVENHVDSDLSKAETAQNQQEPMSEYVMSEEMKRATAQGSIFDELEDL